MLYVLLLVICVIVSIANFAIIINTNIELKQMSKFYDELNRESKDIKKQIDSFNLNITQAKPIENHLFDNNNCLNTPSVINKTSSNDENKDFIHLLKDRCELIDEKYIIPKRTVAIMMDEYNRLENIFSDNFMIIYNKYYITQKGINYIIKNRYVKSVFNDLINQNLIIDFYDDDQINIETQQNDDIIDNNNQKDDKQQNVIAIPKKFLTA